MRSPERRREWQNTLKNLQAYHFPLQQKEKGGSKVLAPSLTAAQVYPAFLSLHTFQQETDVPQQHFDQVHQNHLPTPSEQLGM